MNVTGRTLTTTDTALPDIATLGFKSCGDALFASPLFQISLGSRELFHTNFLYWLLQLYPDACEPLFGISGKGPREIDREKNNLDLTVFWKDSQSALVIENKVKDIPSLEQLTRYDVKIAEQFPNMEVDRILLSMTAPGAWIDDPACGCKWVYHDYSALGQKMESWAQTAQISSRHRPIIGDYAYMVQLMQRFLNLATGPDGLPSENWFLPKPTPYQSKIQKGLADLRMAETVSKYQAARFVINVRETLRLIVTDVESCKLPWIDYEHSLTHKTPLVTARINLRTALGLLRVGVQIQDKQYRRFIEMKNLTRTKSDAVKFSAQELTRFVTERECFRWLLSPVIEDKHIEVSPEGGLKGRLLTGIKANEPIKSYGTDFIYQYVTIDGGLGSLSSKDLLSTLEADLRYAMTLVKDEAYIGRLIGIGGNTGTH